MKPKSPEQRYFLEFIDTHPGDPAEPLYRECQTCQLAGDEGLAACLASGCCLRDTETMRAEQMWVMAVRGWLAALGPPSPEALAIFNDHIGRAKCIRPCLSVDDDGQLIMEFAIPTLRAELHARLLAFYRGMSGYMEVNAVTKKASEIRAEVAEVRERFERFRLRQKKYQAAQLRDQGVSDNQIAQQIDEDRRTIPRWLQSTPTEWPTKREDWYRRYEQGLI